MSHDTIILTRAEYEDLIDARDHAVALRDVATGRMECLSDADMDRYLAAPTALAFWRKHRGFTQAKLAAAIGITQPYLAQIERGIRRGDVVLYAKFAHALGVRIEDLVPDVLPASGSGAPTE